MNTPDFEFPRNFSETRQANLTNEVSLPICIIPDF